MGSSASSAAPALAAALKDRERGFCLFAADALINMGSSSVSALPALLSLSANREENTRLSALRCLTALVEGAAQDASALSAVDRASSLKRWKGTLKRLTGQRGIGLEEKTERARLQEAAQQLVTALQAAKPPGPTPDAPR